MSILVLNAGSSSLKFSLFDDRAELAGAVIQWTGDGPDCQGLRLHPC